MAAERAETARLREELASRPPAAGRRRGESDDAGRRMYERISRELERERATVRDLRRELGPTQAQTAEQRRSAPPRPPTASHTTDRGDAGRGHRRRPRRAAGRRRAGLPRRRRSARALPPRRRGPRRRRDRVPEHEQSAVRVWATRGAAVALVAVLLVALVIIVTAIA